MTKSKTYLLIANKIVSSNSKFILYGSIVRKWIIHCCLKDTDPFDINQTDTSVDTSVDFGDIDVRVENIGDIDYIIKLFEQDDLYTVLRHETKVISHYGLRVYPIEVKNIFNNISIIIDITLNRMSIGIDIDVNCLGYSKKKGIHNFVSSNVCSTQAYKLIKKVENKKASMLSKCVIEDEDISISINRVSRFIKYLKEGLTIENMNKNISLITEEKFECSECSKCKNSKTNGEGGVILECSKCKICFDCFQRYLIINIRRNNCGEFECPECGIEMLPWIV